MTSKLRPTEMLMAMVACLSFLWVAGQWAFLSVPLTLAVIASWFAPQRYSTTPRQQRMIFSAIGLPFLVMGLYNFSRGGVVGFQRIAVLGAVYVLAGGVLELYRKPEQARPAVFHAGIVTVMLVGGLTRANPYYIYCLFVYALGLVGLLTSPVSGMIGGPRTMKGSTAPKAVLVLGFLAAIPLAQFYFSLVPKVSRALYDSYALTLIDNLPQSSRLFRVTSSLSTIQDLRGSDAISARVFGPPAYLRGQVFFKFENGSWSGIQARADRKLMKSSTGRYELGSKDSRDYKVWRIEPVRILSGPLAVPAGAVQIVANVDELEVDPFDGIVADNEHPYQVMASGHPGQGFQENRPRPGTAEWEQAYLQLPDRLKAPLKEHFKRLIGDQVTGPKQSANKLETFLGQNGKYDPGAAHSKREPILHFLGKGNLAGHCEYFATTMTLLLRSQGIPARYVIGYNAAERNPWGDYLIVRDRDAHAWVEVYIDNQWVVFDPTPASEIEQSHPDGWKTPSAAAIWDYVKYLTAGFWRWIASLEGGAWEFQVLLAFAGALCLVALFVLYRFRGSLKFWRKLDSEKEPIRLLGAQFYRALEKRGLRKDASETPLQFSSRVRESQGNDLAEWLISYIELRYRGSDSAQVAELQAKLSSLL